jgi:hypothetical protein
MPGKLYLTVTVFPHCRSKSKPFRATGEFCLAGAPRTASARPRNTRAMPPPLSRPVTGSPYSPADAAAIARRGRKLLRAARLTHCQAVLLDTLLWQHCRPHGQAAACASYSVLGRLAHLARATIAEGLRVLEGLGADQARQAPRARAVGQRRPCVAAVAVRVSVPTSGRLRVQRANGFKDSGYSLCVTTGQRRCRRGGSLNGGARPATSCSGS